MAGNNNLSLAIVVKLLTDNFNKGANKVKSTLLTLQRNFFAFASAAGVGTVGLTNFLSKMIQVSKETSRASIALKNVSESAAAFNENQKWLLDLAKKYGVEINSLTSGFAKFKAAADISSMSLEDQRKIFESVARASVAFGLSAEDQRGVFMALSQMMSKNKVMAEELRLQLAERMPVAIQAMAKAVGVSVNDLDALMKQGKVMSSDVLPKFADALNELIANPDLDNLNKSLVDLSNTFQQLVEKLGIGDLFKRAVELATKALSGLAEHTSAVMTTIKGIMYATFGKALSSIFKGLTEDYDGAVAAAVKSVEKGAASAERAKKAMADLEVAQARVVQAEGKYNREVAKRDKLLERQANLSANAAVKRLAIEENLAIANAKIKQKEFALHQAMEGKKTAATKLAAVQQSAAVQASAEQQVLAAQAVSTGWTRTFNILKYGVASLLKNLKAMLSTTLWTAAITAAMELFNWIRKSVVAARDARRAFENIGNISPTDEEKNLRLWQEQLKSKDENVREGALKQINTALGAELKLEDDVNAAIEHRIKLLQAEARLQRARESYELNLAEWEGLGRLTPHSRRMAVSNQLSGSKAALEDAAAEVAKLTGISPAIEIKPLPTTLASTNSPVKVEVVNLDLEDIEQESFEDYVDRINQQIGGTTPRFADPTVIEAITSRQRDKSRDWSMSDLEILEADKIFAQEQVDALMNYAEAAGVELGTVLSEAIANATNLSDAVRLAEMQEALDEAKKSLRDITLGGIDDAVNDIDNIVGAFDRLKHAIEEDASMWNILMGTFELFTSTASAIIGIIELIAQAKQAAAVIEGITTNAIINAHAGEAAATVGKDVARQAPGFAALVAVPAAIQSTLAAFAAIPRFANGGIVSGGPKQGDKILARLNAGEAVLTPEGLESLHDAANPRNSRKIQISGRLVGRGRDLVAIIGKEDKFKSRIG